MKGYSPRERLGLVMLILVIVGLFLAERLIDASGCERTASRQDAGSRHVTSVPREEGQEPTGNDNSSSALSDSSESQWMRRSDRSEAHRRSDSIRDAGKASLKDSLKSVNNKRAASKLRRSGKTSGKAAPSAPAKPRSLRDERL